MALEMLEGMENWTFFMEELPSLFISSSQLLPQISKLSIADESCPAGGYRKKLELHSLSDALPAVHLLSGMAGEALRDVGWL